MSSPTGTMSVIAPPEEGTDNGSGICTCIQPGTTEMATLRATVQDAVLTGAGRDRSGTAGQSLTAVVAHVDDANPAANANNLSGQITWGDGTTTADTVTSAAGGGFDVSGTHTATPLATTRSAPPSPTSAAAPPAPTPPPKSHPSHHHRDRRRSSRLLPHLPAAPTASASTVSPAARARPARSRPRPPSASP